MKKILLLAALLTGTTAFAQTETNETAKGGTAKDEAVVGESYRVDGTYIAGKGSTQAGGMTSKGFKLRTGQDGARVVFTVQSPYNIESLTIEGIANYDANDASIPAIKVTAVEVDGASTPFDGGEFMGKSLGQSGILTIANINAAESIAIYFDNSNAAGNQINACWEVTYNAPAAAEPTITVTPSELHLIPGGSYQLNVKVVPADFISETFWYVNTIEDFINQVPNTVAEVSEEGLVTALAPGQVDVKHTWIGNMGMNEDTCTVIVSDFNPADATIIRQYDFTTMGDVVLELGQVCGQVWNDANSQCNSTSWATNEGLELLAFQAAAPTTSDKGWIIVDGQGLLDANAGRSAAIGGLKAGDYVEVEYTGDIFAYRDKTQETKLGPDISAPKEIVSETPGDIIVKIIEVYNEETGEYSGSEDLCFGFEINRGCYVKRITIYDATGSAGINEISQQDARKAAPAYNLAGQRVANGYNGLVVKSGKKVMVK